MKVTKLIVITIFVVGLLEIIAFEAFIRLNKFSAKDSPSWFESTMANHVRDVSIPSDVKAMKNPRPITNDVMAEAREHWVEHCSVCHSTDGSGNTVIGHGLYPKPPNMKEAITQQKTDGELFYIMFV